MVADAHNRKPRGILASLALEDWKRSTSVVGYELQYNDSDGVTLVYNVTATTSHFQHAKETQWQDVELREVWNKLQNSEQLDGLSMNQKRFFSPLI